MESEKAVLGAVLMDPDTLMVIEGMLKPDHFFLDAIKKYFLPFLIYLRQMKVPTFSQLRISYGAQRAISITLAGLFGQFVGKLSGYAKYRALCQYRADRLLSQTNYRNLPATIEQAIEYKGSIAGYIEAVEKEFLSITKDSDRKGITGGREVLDATIEDIENKLSRGDEITGVPTGFIEMDKLNGGWQRSDLVILAARPGMGKTAFALNCVANAARSGKHVVVFTLEMTQQQLMSRILSSEARVDSSNWYAVI